MAAITSFYQKLGRDIPMNDLGGTATPVRVKEYFLDFNMPTNADTIDLNAAVDKNINKLMALSNPLVDLSPQVTSGGTTIISSGDNGTSLVCQGGAGRYTVTVTCAMKA